MEAGRRKTASLSDSSSASVALLPFSHLPPLPLAPSLLCSLPAQGLPLLSPGVCPTISLVVAAPVPLRPDNCQNTPPSFNSHCSLMLGFSFSRRGI